jgi:hypothetical protein
MPQLTVRQQTQRLWVPQLYCRAAHPLDADLRGQQHCPTVLPGWAEEEGLLAALLAGSFMVVNIV